MPDNTMFREVPEVVHHAVLEALDSLEDMNVITGERSVDIDMINTREKYVSADTIIGEEYVSTEYIECCKDTHRLWHFGYMNLRRISLACAGILFLVLVSMYGAHIYRQHKAQEVLEAYCASARAGEVTSFSRNYTVMEAERYAEIKTRLEEYGTVSESTAVTGHSMQLGEVQGDGYDLDGIILDTERKLLYLPEHELTDQELYEIIEFSEKIDYKVSIKEDAAVNGSGDSSEMFDGNDADGWGYRKRMLDMSEAEMDSVYLAMYSAKTDRSGAYSRPLDEYEMGQYEMYLKGYEQNDAAWINEWLSGTMNMEIYERISDVPKNAAGVYTGDRITICVEDSTFYLPERHLTDEELLQLIDYEHKAAYSIQKITAEVQTGLRQGYPQWSEE